MPASHKYPISPTDFEEEEDNSRMCPSQIPMLTGEMVLVLTHLTRSTPLGTNTEARWLGLNGVSIVMVRFFGQMDGDFVNAAIGWWRG